MTHIKIKNRIFEKHSDTQFHENPSVCLSACCYMQTDRRTDMTKLTVVFLNFSNASRNETNPFSRIRIYDIFPSTSLLWKTNCLPPSPSFFKHESSALTIHRILTGSRTAVKAITNIMYSLFYYGLFCLVFYQRYPGAVLIRDEFYYGFLFPKPTSRRRRFSVSV